jgi:hypothetical protein
MSIDEIRRRAALDPTEAPRFADWLRERMNGTFSRARLTRETRISDGALRNYLAGQTLPDTDQAQRIAEILDVEPLELAKVLVADHTVRAGGTTIAAPENIYDTSGTNGRDARQEDHAAETASTPALPGRTAPSSIGGDEEQLLYLWRQLHPQGRRATLNYIASLLVEG